MLAVELELLGESVQIGHWPDFRQCKPASTILLEFTPLAYSRVGFSLPLLLQVCRWNHRGCRVVSYFHELPFPNGHQWKRRLAVLIQWLYCLILTGLSWRCLVNQESGLRHLKWPGSGNRVSFLPVFSNIGQAVTVDHPLQRPLQVIVFGSAGKRRHAHSLVAESGGYRRVFGPLVRVLDVGEPLNSTDPIPAEVECLGPLSSESVFELLLHSRYGFFYSEPDQFSKSGVFAAYCAAGVIPVIACRSPSVSPYYLGMADLVSSATLDIRTEAVWSRGREWASRFNAKTAAATILSAFL